MMHTRDETAVATLVKGSETVPTVTIRCVVTHTDTECRNKGVVVQRCTVKDVHSGIESKDLPCAAMDLRPGDVVTVTVCKAH